MGNQVSAHGCFHHLVEAQLLDAGDHLVELGVSELAGDAGGDDGVNLLVALEHTDGVQDKGLVGQGTEGTLVDTGAAEMHLSCSILTVLSGFMEMAPTLQAFWQGRFRLTMAE